MSAKQPADGRFAAVGAVCRCAGMSEQACLATDWRAVGFEDGAGGRRVSRIGVHRQQRVTQALDYYSTVADDAFIKNGDRPLVLNQGGESVGLLTISSVLFSSNRIDEPFVLRKWSNSAGTSIETDCSPGSCLTPAPDRAQA